MSEEYLVSISGRTEPVNRRSIGTVRICFESSDPVTGRPVPEADIYVNFDNDFVICESFTLDISSVRETMSIIRSYLPGIRVTFCTKDGDIVRSGSLDPTAGGYAKNLLVYANLTAQLKYIEMEKNYEHF